VHIVVDVAKKDAHWLRTSSIFTLVRGLVGGTNIRAFTGILTDPPLPDGAQRPVLRGDATAELPRVLAAAKETLENLSAITAQDAALRTSLANLRDVTEKLKGPRGALGAVFGNEADAQKLVAALDRANALLARLDGMVGKADTQVFGPEGVVKEARATVVQLNGLLAETRTSLKKVDAVLVEAQGISANVRGATTDLGALRADVDANLRKIEGMINELNRKWPFARDTEVKLP
jgi:phospholipid/cholesterol/gamma-HCH transport system substrate-binding protein